MIKESKTSTWQLDEEDMGISDLEKYPLDVIKVVIKLLETERAQ